MSEHTEDDKWPALLRFSILGSVANKHINYIGFVNRNAQGILTIHAFLVPLSLANLDNEHLRMPLAVFIGFTIISALAAVICLMPKRYRSGEGENCHLLHFSGISRYSQEEYSQRMKGLMDNREQLAEAFVQDQYHLSRDVIQPKFFWMRVSYYVFLAGAAICLSMILPSYL